eukprot:COSAG01_NODE_19257_length_1021_cov_1.343818_2_plen_129_part_00
MLMRATVDGDDDVDDDDVADVASPATELAACFTRRIGTSQYQGVMMASNPPPAMMRPAGNPERARDAGARAALTIVDSVLLCYRSKILSWPLHHSQPQHSTAQLHSNKQRPAPPQPSTLRPPRGHVAS